MEEALEINLQQILKLLWRNKIFIILVTVLAGTITVFASLKEPKVYRASALLSTIETVVFDDNGRPQKIGLPATFYTPLIKNEFILEQIIKESGLDKKPYDLTRNKLQGMIKTSIEGDGHLININVEMSNPVIAKDIANSIANKLVDLSSQLKNGEGTRYQDFLQQQVNLSKDKLDGIDRRMLVFRKKSDLEVLKQRLNNKLAQRGRFESDYEDIVNNIKIEEEHLKEIAQNFKEQEKTFKLAKSISEDPTFNQVVAKASQQDINNLLGLKMESEEVNPLYQELRSQLVNVTINLANMKIRKQVLEKRIEDTKSELELLGRENADKEAQLESIQRQFNLAKEEYTVFAKQVAQAKTLVSASMGNVSIVSYALEPIKTYNSKIIARVCSVIILSLLLSAILVLLKEFFIKSLI